MRRLAKLGVENPDQLSPDQVVDEIIELDTLSREIREVLVGQLERRPHLSRAEERLLEHFRGAPAR